MEKFALPSSSFIGPLSSSLSQRERHRYPGLSGDPLSFSFHEETLPLLPPTPKWRCTLPFTPKVVCSLLFDQTLFSDTSNRMSPWNAIKYFFPTTTTTPFREHYRFPSSMNSTPPPFKRIAPSPILFPLLGVWSNPLSNETRPYFFLPQQNSSLSLKANSPLKPVDSKLNLSFLKSPPKDSFVLNLLLAIDFFCLRLLSSTLFRPNRFVR